MDNMGKGTLRSKVIEMTKWQYCAIKVDLGESKTKKLKFFSSTGDHTASKIEDIHLKIAKLGEEGWELVTLTEISDPSGRVYYFKKSV